MTIKRPIICTCLLVALCCGGVSSDDKPAGKNSDAVGKSLASLAAAYNAHDPKAISELFTAAGEFIDGDGNVFQGRDAISGEFAALFEVHPQSAIKLSADDIRELTPGVLAVDCVAQLAAAKPTPDAEGVELDFAALLVRQTDGRWLLASIRSHGERSLHSPHAHLKRLEWLIGDWVEESNESTMRTNSRWSEDGNFILSDFAIHVTGRKVMTGTQRIGWDESLEKFRSWVFDSEGGFAEGIWTETEDRWIVKSTGVRPDGNSGSATQTYQPQSPHAYVFAVTDRIIGDEPQSDFMARVVRQPPDPERSSTAPAPRSGR